MGSGGSSKYECFANDCLGRTSLRWREIIKYLYSAELWTEQRPIHISQGLKMYAHILDSPLRNVRSTQKIPISGFTLFK